jgi:TRAP-type mannitol/chloroaromatic compound transport system permease small subunit
VLVSANESQIIAGTLFGFMGIYICFIVFMAATFITLFVFWIIGIVDISQRKNEEFPNPEDNPRSTWLIILLVTLVIPLAAGIAAIIYYATIIRKYPRDSFQPATESPEDGGKNNRQKKID